MTADPRDSGPADLERALRALVADERRVRVPPHVHAAVMQAWDRAMSSVTPRRAPRRVRLAVVAATIASAALIITVAFDRRRPEPTLVDPAPIASMEPLPSANMTLPEIEAPVVRSKPPRRRSRAERAPRTTTGIVLVADPILDGSALSVVRVRVPLSALINFGIPVPDPDAQGSVDLEMLVGEDGIARTIRRAVPVTTSEPQE
jgi:hypothetical protein